MAPPLKNGIRAIREGYRYGRLVHPLSLEVVLVGLHERLHKLCRDQAHIIALLAQCACEEVRPGTSLHADGTSRVVIPTQRASHKTRRRIAAPVLPSPWSHHELVMEEAVAREM